MTSKREITQELKKKYGYMLDMQQAANELHISYNSLSRSNIERFRVGKKKCFKTEVIVDAIIERMA